MALLKCPDCGGTVSDKADACPICGKPVKNILAQLAGEDTGDGNLETTVPSEISTDTKQDDTTKTSVGTLVEIEKENQSCAQELDLHRSEPENQKTNEDAKIKIIIGCSIGLAVIVLLGIILIPRFSSPNSSWEKISSLIDSHQYEKASLLLQEYTGSVDQLDREEQKQILQYYSAIVQDSNNSDYRKTLLQLLRNLYNKDDQEMSRYLEQTFPDEVNHLQIIIARENYEKGKIGSARDICSALIDNIDYITFEDKCELAVLLCAIGKVDNQLSFLKSGAQLFKKTIAFDQTRASLIYDDANLRYKINIATISKQVDEAIEQENESKLRRPSEVQNKTADKQMRSVVVTGTNVRVRKGPGLEYDPLTDYNGKNIHPTKGQKLEYFGESNGFYQVRFDGNICWISKQFATLSSEEAD